MRSLFADGSLKSFGPGFGGEFGRQFSEALAAKFKELLGFEEPAQPQGGSATEDGRRYTQEARRIVVVAALLLRSLN